MVVLSRLNGKTRLVHYRVVHVYHYTRIVYVFRLKIVRHVLFVLYVMHYKILINQYFYGILENIEIGV